MQSLPDKRLSEFETRFYISCLVLVFKYLTNSVIYHDLKPENIMIHSDGYPRLCDFGLAENVNQDGSKNQSEVWYIG